MQSQGHRPGTEMCRLTGVLGPRNGKSEVSQSEGQGRSTPRKGAGDRQVKTLSSWSLQMLKEGAFGLKCIVHHMTYKALSRVILLELVFLPPVTWHHP